MGNTVAPIVNVVCVAALGVLLKAPPVFELMPMLAESLLLTLMAMVFGPAELTIRRLLHHQDVECLLRTGQEGGIADPCMTRAAESHIKALAIVHHEHCLGRSLGPRLGQLRIRAGGSSGTLHLDHLSLTARLCGDESPSQPCNSADGRGAVAGLGQQTCAGRLELLVGAMPMSRKEDCLEAMRCRTKFTIAPVSNNRRIRLGWPPESMNSQ